MEIVLKRIDKKGTYTIGRLYLLTDASVKRISLPGKKGTAMMLRNWENRHYIEKIPPKGANADGGDRKQGGKVFSIQLFSFKKLLYRSDGLDLRGFNV